MKGMDLTTKLILLVLALGVWALALRPVVPPTMAQAQGHEASQYAIVTWGDPDNPDDHHLEIGGPGYVKMNAPSLAVALGLVSEQGWRVHTVLCPDGANYMVIAER